MIFMEAFSSEKFGVLIEDVDDLYSLSAVLQLEKKFQDSDNSLSLTLKGMIKVDFS